MALRILIVEDDDHKIADVQAVVRQVFPTALVVTHRSVREGSVAVTRQNFDLIILDLSLPTFDQSASASGGVGQPQGGFEVLRMLKRLSKRPDILIVSQYYQVELDGKYTSLPEANTLIAARFNANLVGCLLYTSPSPRD